MFQQTVLQPIKSQTQFLKRKGFPGKLIMIRENGQVAITHGFIDNKCYIHPTDRIFHNLSATLGIPLIENIE